MGLQEDNLVNLLAKFKFFFLKKEIGWIYYIPLL